MNTLVVKWFACRVTSGRKSAQFGLRFSYPFYISIVAMGLLLRNPYILSMAAVIAFLGIVLPMHPFDYLYNHVVTRLVRVGKIPGRGSELQVNSTVALLFNLGAIASIIYGAHLDYGVMTLIYVLSSIFFVMIHIFGSSSTSISLGG